MRCPDCKIILTKENVVDSELVDPKGNGIGCEVPILECPKCGNKYNRDELLEMNYMIITNPQRGENEKI
jgi:transcriptional regulator NrdR family protein